MPRAPVEEKDRDRIRDGVATPSRLVACPPRAEFVSKDPQSGPWSVHGPGPEPETTKRPRFEMERTRTSPSSPTSSRVERQLAPLKLISRLLGHELHAQQSPRITLSREELLEVQTTIDLHIEAALRGAKGNSGAGAGPGQLGSELEVQPVPTRVN